MNDEEDSGLVVSEEELRNYMSGIELSSAQRESMKQILYGVQFEVRSFINRPILPETITEQLVPDGRGYVFPKATPIRKVESVETLPTSFGPSPRPVTHTVVGNSIFVSYMGIVSVTYTSGLSEGDVGLVRSIILRAAAREVETRHDDTLSVKDLDTNEQPPKQPYGLSDEERRALSRLKRRVMI